MTVASERRIHHRRRRPFPWELPAAAVSLVPASVAVFQAVSPLLAWLWALGSLKQNAAESGTIPSEIPRHGRFLVRENENTDERVPTSHTSQATDPQCHPSQPSCTSTRAISAARVWLLPRQEPLTRLLVLPMTGYGHPEKRNHNIDVIQFVPCSLFLVMRDPVVETKIPIPLSLVRPAHDVLRPRLFSAQLAECLRYLASIHRSR